jgi:hypothetical protein
MGFSALCRGERRNAFKTCAQSLLIEPILVKDLVQSKFCEQRHLGPTAKKKVADVRHDVADLTLNLDRT